MFPTGFRSGGNLFTATFPVDREVFSCYSNHKILKKKIEVAFFKSTFSDAAGAEEGKGKGNTPKEGMICSLTLGHAVKSCMTVICS